MVKLISIVITLATLLMSFGSSPASAQEGPFGTTVINSGSTMVPDRAYYSYSRLYFVVFQSTDGNLVVYRVGQGSNKAIWSTNSFGGKIAAMQGDGNFVIYNSAGSAIWDSATWGGSGGSAFITDRGVFLVNGSKQFRSPADPQAPPAPCTELRQFPICVFPGRATQFNSWVEACNVADAQQRAAAMGASYGRCPGT